MISMVYHTDMDKHYLATDICEIISIAKGTELWKIKFYHDSGLVDYWYVGLDASETIDSVPDSVTVGGRTYEGRAGIERLASVPVDVLNQAEETYRALEEL